MRILWLIALYTIYMYASVGTIVDIVGKATLTRSNKHINITKNYLLKNMIL